MTTPKVPVFADEWAAVSALNALTSEDSEAAHAKADEILLAMVPPVVRAAYENLRDKRCRYWC